MEKENKLHWVSWETLSSRKDKGGMGYRDLHLFNLAMLARQAWHICKTQNLYVQYYSQPGIAQVVTFCRCRRGRDSLTPGAALCGDLKL